MLGRGGKRAETISQSRFRAGEGSSLSSSLRNRWFSGIGRALGLLPVLRPGPRVAGSQATEYVKTRGPSRKARGSPAAVSSRCKCRPAPNDDANAVGAKSSATVFLPSPLFSTTFSPILVRRHFPSPSFGFFSFLLPPIRGNGSRGRVEEKHSNANADRITWRRGDVRRFFFYLRGGGGSGNSSGVSRAHGNEIAVWRVIGKNWRYQGWCRVTRDRGRGELNGRRRSLPRFWTRIDRKIFLLNVSFKEERKIIGTIRF